MSYPVFPVSRGKHVLLLPCYHMEGTGWLCLLELCSWRCSFCSSCCTLCLRAASSSASTRRDGTEHGLDQAFGLYVDTPVVKDLCTYGEFEVCCLLHFNPFPVSYRSMENAIVFIFSGPWVCLLFGPDKGTVSALWNGMSFKDWHGKPKRLAKKACKDLPLNKGQLAGKTWEVLTLSDWRSLCPCHRIRMVTPMRWSFHHTMCFMDI